MLGAMNAVAQVSGADASSIGASSIGAGAKLANGAVTAAPAPFADLITAAVGQVNQLEEQAQTAVSGLITGSGTDVHQAMIATEKASMAFELALAVRTTLAATSRRPPCSRAAAALSAFSIRLRSATDDSSAARLCSSCASSTAATPTTWH